MNIEKIELKPGINLHFIERNNFKTDICAAFLTTKLTKETVTKNSLLTAVLRRGTKNLSTQEEINKRLEEMYGSFSNCGIDKIGDNQVLKFYIETIREEFLPEKENILEEGLNLLQDMVFNPYTENGAFKKQYVEGEKEVIKQKIEGKIDDKANYAVIRTIEEMYKGEAYGLYKYGYKEDLANIDEKELYNHYINLINTCKIDIFISGDASLAKNILQNSGVLKNLPERTPDYIPSKIAPKNKSEEQVLQESLDVAQGKLVLALNSSKGEDETKFALTLYNAILGGTANSKLFQNVREKASLAYTAGSSYIREKALILVKCGIEIKNYEKALQIIKTQIQDMAEGKFEEEELENAKQSVISAIKTIREEQDTEIVYYLGQELAQTELSLKQYEEEINKVTKDQIVNIAASMNISQIYFLKD